MIADNGATDGSAIPGHVFLTNVDIDSSESGPWKYRILLPKYTAIICIRGVAKEGRGRNEEAKEGGRLL